MIVDPHSRVITMNVRNKDNKVTTSKSFQVFATRDILEATLKCYRRNCTISSAWCAANCHYDLCLDCKSLHYQSDEVSIETIQNVLRDYVRIEDVYYVRALLDNEDEKLHFVNKAFQMALCTHRLMPIMIVKFGNPLTVTNKITSKSIKRGLKKCWVLCWFFVKRDVFLL